MNNVSGTLTLLQLLDEYDCHSFVFSSSATVYGCRNPMPLTEDATVIGTDITNPYGKSKYMIEEILKDFYQAKKDTDWRIVILRYFNPVGAHPSGKIGEDPNGIPRNIMPYICQVAIGRRDKLTVFGSDYATKDGTGVRDFIHVCCLAEGHLSAMNYLKQRRGYYMFNLGTGIGISVMEMIEGMRRASGKEIPYVFGERRTGDISVMYANPEYAQRELQWKATRDIDDMCRDSWNWQSSNPNGYGS